MKPVESPQKEDINCNDCTNSTLDLLVRLEPASVMFLGSYKINGVYIYKGPYSLKKLENNKAAESLMDR